MKTETHQVNQSKIAEVITDELVIKSTADGLQLLGDLYYQGFDGIILHMQQIAPDFFDLKNGMAGDILQKFSNYRMPLAIVGDYSHLQSKSMKDFIVESNRQGHVNFVASVVHALECLKRQMK